MGNFELYAVSANISVRRTSLSAGAGVLDESIRRDPFRQQKRMPRAHQGTNHQPASAFAFPYRYTRELETVVSDTLVASSGRQPGKVPGPELQAVAVGFSPCQSGIAEDSQLFFKKKNYNRGFAAIVTKKIFTKPSNLF